MKLRVAHLGYIERAEIDLRPMTVIIGPNNTGKTYLSYVIYGLFQQVQPRKQARFRSIWSEDRRLFDKISSRGAKSGTIRLRVRELLEFHAVSLRRDAARLVKGLTALFQDSTGRLFRDASLSLDIEPGEYDALFAANSFTTEKGMLGRSKPGDSLFASDVLDLLDREFFPAPFLLPAERNALVITYKLLANRRYKIMKEAQRELFSARTSRRAAQQLELLREQGEVRYPQPVEDFLDFLTDIELEVDEKKERAEAAPFLALADQIEEHIQNRHGLRFRPTRLGGNEIRVHVSDDLDIDLYNASSSIKQLTPLLLYLRFRAASGQMLMIDEPEMNLHPESQARLMEALGILVNLGVNVLLTTHSPYIMAHLNNIVRDQAPASAAAGKKLAGSLYLQDPRSLLTQEQVSAYEVRDRTLRSLKDPDYGIRWGSLGEVSESLQQRYFKLAEQESKAKQEPKSKQASRGSGRAKAKKR